MFNSTALLQSAMTYNIAYSYKTEINENSEINRKTWVKENVRETVSHPSTLLPPSVNIVDTHLYFTITYYFL